MLTGVPVLSKLSVEYVRESWRRDDLKWSHGFVLRSLSANVGSSVALEGQ